MRVCHFRQQISLYIASTCFNEAEITYCKNTGVVKGMSKNSFGVNPV